MVKPNARKKPLLPDGSEVYIGLVAAGALGLVLLLNDYPMWSYVLAAVFTFLACVIGFQIWNEDDRQYWKGIALSRELSKALEGFDPAYVRDRVAWKHIKAGVQNAKLILEELLKKSPTRMYGGMATLAPHVRKAALLFDEYVDVQDNPAKVGGRYDEVMQLSNEGFEGFDEEMARLLVQVNKDDILNLTTSAEILRSLRNLLSGSSR